MRIEALDPPQTTADLVVERIASVIKSRKLAARERLPGEHELVEQLQVSRPILREALAQLQSMGLVDIQRVRGTFVSSATSLANCVRLLRSAIEVQAARQAAERATDEDLAELTGILKKLDIDDLPYIAHYADTHGFERDQLRPNAWQYRVSLLKNFKDGFCPGLHLLPDGTMVATTYATYRQDDGGCSIVSIRSRCLMWMRWRRRIQNNV